MKIFDLIFSILSTKILKAIFLLFLLANQITVNGQEFGSADTKWVFDFMFDGITIIEFEKDTSFNDSSIKKFIPTTISILESDTIYTPRDPFFTYESDSVIYYSTYLPFFQPLYKFNVKAGDNWKIYKDSIKSDSILYEVLGLFQTEINGNNILSQSINTTRYWSNGSITSFVDTIFQFVGAKYSYMLPFKAEKIYPDGGILRCFENDDFGQFEIDNQFTLGVDLYSNFIFECGEITSIANDTRRNIVIFPNPTSGLLYVNNFSSDESILTIWSASGQIVFKERLDVNKEIDISHLNPGIYIIQMGNYYVEKIFLAPHH